MFPSLNLNPQMERLVLIIAILIAVAPAIVTVFILIFWHPTRENTPRFIRAFPVIFSKSKSSSPPPIDPASAASKSPPH